MALTTQQNRQSAAAMALPFLTPTAGPGATYSIPADQRMAVSFCYSGIYVFPTAVCLGHFHIKEIRFELATKLGTVVTDPEQWETICVKNNIKFNVQLKQPLVFTKRLSKVLNSDDC